MVCIIIYDILRTNIYIYVLYKYIYIYIIHEPHFSASGNFYCCYTLINSTPKMYAGMPGMLLLFNNTRNILFWFLLRSSYEIIIIFGYLNIIPYCHTDIYIFCAVYFVYKSMFLFKISVIGPNTRINVFLLIQSTLTLPIATTEAALGRLVINAISPK